MFHSTKPFTAKWSLFILCYLASSATNLFAEVKMPAIFCDHMVLQRETIVPIWGWAEPGEEVTVEFAGQKQSVKTSKSGRWTIQLHQMVANAEGNTLTISGANIIKLNDVLVGEVWLASGQSNMAMTARKTSDWEGSKASADDSLLRLFKVAPKEVSPLKTVDDCRGEWTLADETTAGNITAAGYFFARQLRSELKVPVGLIDSSWGGTLAEYWTSREALESSPVTKPLWDTFKKRVDEFDPATATPKEELQRLMDVFRKKNAEARKNKTRRPRPPKTIGPPSNKRYAVCNMYNTMIHPIIPYALRGAIWYQGEGNRERAEQYETLLPIMIEDWRTRWSRQNLPVGIVQLANIKDNVLESPQENVWPEQQWAHFRVAQSVPNTGLAVINDGKDTTLHPREKKKIGDRLALWALSQVYHQPNIDFSGPIYRSMKIEDSTIRIQFDHANGLKTTNNQKLQGFQIAGEDRNWVWADAKLDGETVIVSSPKISKPVAVRYAWAANPMTAYPKSANLTNASGLPTSLFKTDDWPGLSHGRLVPDTK